MIVRILVVCWMACHVIQQCYACTTILVGKKATVDGSLMVTHNNDCTDCDIRIGLVPARDHPMPSQCNIAPCKFTYPRWVGEDRGSTYSKTNLEPMLGTYPNTKSLGHHPQVAHTYSYLDGTYPITNEHGLSMGESTCSANLVAYGYPLGDALFDVSALQRVAMERCKTARCAIQTMGDLATKYGYYGANDPPEEGAGLYEESGEALTLIDPHEAWVFHILPDDTGRSAVWAAQRLEDDHITVVPNKFIIRTVNTSDTERYMASDNMRQVAVRAGLWPANNHDLIDFQKAFSPECDVQPGWADRRTWRIFSWAAPSLKLKANGPAPFPFSVPVDRPLSLHELFKMNRDHFEGTEYDLSVGPAAGPYRNPTRYDHAAKPEYAGGYFERAISLHRTTYSYVATARSWVPPELAGIVWFAQHAPHSSVFVPIYSATRDIPLSYKQGNIYAAQTYSSWWAFTRITNFAEKSYMFVNQDVSRQATRFEHAAVKHVDHIDTRASAMLYLHSDNSTQQQIYDLLTNFTVQHAQHVTDFWYAFHDYLVTKYRDGYRLESFLPPYNAQPIFYPAWWLGRVGFYDSGPLVIPASKTLGEPPAPPHPITPGGTQGNEQTRIGSHNVAENAPERGDIHGSNHGMDLDKELNENQHYNLNTIMSTSDCVLTHQQCPSRVTVMDVIRMVDYKPLPDYPQDIPIPTSSYTTKLVQQPVMSDMPIMSSSSFSSLMLMTVMCVMLAGAFMAGMWYQKKREYQMIA